MNRLSKLTLSNSPLSNKLTINLTIKLFSNNSSSNRINSSSNRVVDLFLAKRKY